MLGAVVVVCHHAMTQTNPWRLFCLLLSEQDYADSCLADVVNPLWWLSQLLDKCRLAKLLLGVLRVVAG